MQTWLLLKILHVISATVLFGTGLGIAFFMWRAYRGGDPVVLAAVAGQVVLADIVFTLPAVILQPVTGVLLAAELGYPLGSSWLLASIALYLVAGACWLPVLWLQWRVRALARAAAAAREPLPDAVRRCMRWWTALGWPAFTALIAVFWLMVARPA